jgi:hypothetical protein
MKHFHRSVPTKWSRRSGTELRRVWLPVLCLVALLWSCASHADFEYTEFIDAGDQTIAGMTLNRSRSNSGIPTGPPENRLRLTIDLFGDRRASAWYNTKQPVGDVWETVFTYQHTNVYADGFAFVIQHSPDGTAALGTDIDGGGGKGYAGITNCLAIEFDAYHSDLSVHSNGSAANRHNTESQLATTAFTGDDDEHEVKITHSPGSPGTLQVFHDNMTTPVLTVDYDLSAIGWDTGSAYVGFTGGTGGGSQTCDILSWSFDATDTLPPSTPFVWSASHPVTWSVNDDTIIVNWTGSEDYVSGVDGYSFVFDTNPGTASDTTIDLAHTTDPHSMTYDSLAEDSYYFHLRTGDSADHWTGTMHYGPMIVDFNPPGAPIGAPLALGLLVAAVAVAGARLVRRRP